MKRRAKEVSSFEEFSERHRVTLCAALALLCAAVLALNVQVLGKGALETQVAINDPTYCLFAGNGRQYIVAEGATEILVLDDGEYLFSIEGGRRTGGFYYAQSIAADEEGNLYVHDRCSTKTEKTSTASASRFSALPGGSRNTCLKNCTAIWTPRGKTQPAVLADVFEQRAGDDPC